jgi:hypothetical protein
LRHRDSLSPVLFDLVVDALAIIMNDTWQDTLYCERCSRWWMWKWYNHALVCWWYPFLDNIVSTQNLIFIFCVFWGKIWLQSYYSQKWIVLVWGAQDKVKFIGEFLLAIWKIPIKYIGMPTSKTTLRNKDYNFVKTKIAGKCSSGTIVQGILTNMKMFMMSLLHNSFGRNKKVVFHRARLVWQEKPMNTSIILPDGRWYIR